MYSASSSSSSSSSSGFSSESDQESEHTNSDIPKRNRTVEEEVVTGTVEEEEVVTGRMEEEVVTGTVDEEVVTETVVEAEVKKMDRRQVVMSEDVIEHLKRVVDYEESPFPVHLQKDDKNIPALEKAGWIQAGNTFTCLVTKCDQASFQYKSGFSRHWDRTHRPRLATYYCPQEECNMT